MDVETNSNEAKHPEIVSAQQSAALCQSCGLCCNGSLFSFVGLKEPDLEALKGTPIKTRSDKDDKTIFSQPCAALSGTSCSIYEKRPGACRSYLCSLTRGVLNGSNDLESALGHVLDMKTRGAWLLENVPRDMFKQRAATPDKKPVTAKNILKMWQASKPENPKARQDETIAAATSLWTLLSLLHPRFLAKHQQVGLSPEDRDYIANAFAYTKRCDRWFEKTSLLRKYAELVQRF